MKFVFLLCLICSANVFASLELTGGKLYEYEEDKDEWKYVDENCSVTISNPRIEESKPYQYLVYDLKLKNFNRKVKENQKVGQNLSLMDLPSPTMRLDSFTEDRATLNIDRASLNDLQKLHIKVHNVIAEKTTFFSGYFGGRRYRWSYKCEF